jgi:hypothetical protein
MKTNFRKILVDISDMIKKVPTPDFLHELPPDILSLNLDYKSKLETKAKEVELKWLDNLNKHEDNRRSSEQLKSKLAEMASCSGKFFADLAEIVGKLNLLLGTPGKIDLSISVIYYILINGS